MEKKNEIKNESLSANFIFNIIYQIIVVLTPLILTPKLSRVFQADYIGIKGYTFSIVYYFAIFGLLGLDMLGQRKIALVKDDLEKRSKIFWTIYLTRFALVAFATFIYLCTVQIISEGFEKKIFLFWTIYLVREMINPIWYLQGIEKYKSLSLLNILSQILYLILTFVFINEKNDLPLYIIFFTSIPLFVSLLYFPLVFKYTKFVRIALKDMVQSVRESIVYFIPTIATAVYSMIDKTMLGIFDSSKVSTGLYESAEKLVKVALAFSTASFTIIRTRMTNLYSKNNEEEYKSNYQNFIAFSMLLCWPIMFGIIGVAKDFVPLFFGEGFDEVTNLCYAFSFVIPCLTISGLIQAIYFFPYGLQKKMNLYFVIIVLLNIALNIVFINFFESVGAVIASLISEFTLAVILLIESRKAIEIKNFFIYSIKYFISAAIMLCVIIVVSLFVQIQPIYKIILEIGIGVLTYFISCLILRDKFVLNFLDLIIKKVFKKSKE